MNEPIIQQFKLGPIDNFLYILACPITRKAALIDPTWDIKLLLEALAEKNLSPAAVILTHTHPDHVGGENFLGIDKIEGLKYLLEKIPPLPIFVHKNEKETTPAPENLITTTEEDSQIEIGTLKISCLHTPGHTPGSQCFLVNKNLFTGDTLFCGSRGRTDLPGSNLPQLKQSLARLAKLDDDIKVLPGHDYHPKRPTSTIGYECLHNPHMPNK